MIEFVVYACVVWRITHLLVAEQGPFQLFERIRNVTAKLPQLGEPLHCQYCASLWVAFGFAYFAQPMWADRIIWTLALSGAALLLDRFSDRKMQLLTE